MKTFEESLGERLKRVADGTKVSPQLEALVEARRSRPPRRAPGARQAVAVAAAVLLVVGTVVLIGATSTSPAHGRLGPTGTLANPRTSTAAGWHVIAPAPLPARSEYEAVWTGKEFIVWGGYDAGGNLADGAAYDPATNTWRTLPPAPLAPRAAPVGVWTGTEMIVAGGSSNSSYSDGAAYDPATNRWHRIAPIPASLGGNLTATGSYAVWTGSTMLVWGFFGTGAGSHGGGSLRAASYDPATNSWSAGTAAPTQAPLFGDAFWTGTRMIVWGQHSPAETVTRAANTHDRTVPRSTDFGISYDPATGAWRYVPKAPLRQPGLSATLAAWTGKELVVGGGELAHGNSREAATYDPSTGKWERLPEAPVGFTGNGNYPDVWTGSLVISLEDSVSGGRPLELDLATRTWRLGPRAPRPGRLEADETWTGSEVLVWGGGTATSFPGGGGGCCTTVTKGYSFVPEKR